MDIIEGVFVLLLGFAIGSFLNVIILRHNTGRSINGRSRCGSCNKVLAWYELIPVISYACLRGRCLSCKSPLALQYPLVELAVGLLFLGAYTIAHSYIELLFLCVVLSLFVVIFVYDARHKIIPDSFVFLLGTLALASTFFDFTEGVVQVPSVMDVFAGPILFLPFFALWLYSSGRWMGLGDGKLAAAIGWLLGLQFGFSAIVLGFWMGAIAGLVLIVLHRYAVQIREQMQLLPVQTAVTMESEIPFAPFLILGYVLVLFFGIDVFELFALY